MSDKDQFTFDDDDDFPETDLSDAFSDGEHEAENPAPEVEEEPEPTKKAKKPKKEKKPSSGGGSRTRILLLVLLLVVAGAGGAYYFMDLGGTTPSVPTAPVPANKAQKSVALPPKPTPAPATPAPAKAEPAAKPVTVAVPPPPAQTSEKAAPDKGQVTAAKPQPVPAAVPEGPKAEEQPKQATQAAVQVPAPKPAPKASAAEMRPAATPAPAPKAAVAAAPEPKPAEKSAAPPKQVADGAFALDAGSYLFETNRDALIAKIKKLGYEPLVTPIDATLDMTRLRLGTFSKDEIQEALDFARSIESGSYSSPAGDNYVIYAGTFLSKGNIDNLIKRFQAEGVKVYPEPVQVVRTLSRIRFGSFANKADAEVAASVAADGGVNAVVVKSK